MSQPSQWWNAGKHADRRPFLIARGRIKAAIRSWFEGQGFTEVEPGCLQVSPGNETHLHAFATELIGIDLLRHALYLHTSPEFAMKKLLAAGERKIFTFAPVFRNREKGVLHSPEFTMLEWYRAEAPYEMLWKDCATILALAAEATGHHAWSFRGRTCDPSTEPEHLTVAQAFADLARVEINRDRECFKAAAAKAGIRVADDDTWSDVFSRVIVDKVEPALGSPRPTILYQYPVCEAALARPVPDNHSVAERFELYVSGVELANGFGELTDADEQRRRFVKWMDEKSRIYGYRYPIDEDFLAALATMPAASGCALGFDRLAMLASGAERIEQVIWTPLV